MSIEKLRNIAIIAHVDHGKTTLVDKLLQQSGTLDRKNMDSERIMDSNDQEKERGITITAKNTSIIWEDHLINIVDTPGHADFGGEVERALSMVDSVLLLVDAVDGPMPQTRFVTQKAFEKGLKPIVVINKVDRDDARPHWVLDQVFDLFDRLGATDEQLDFPVIYASAIQGISGLEPDQMTEDMIPLLRMILDKVSAPEVNIDGPLQLQISALDSNSYVGVIGIGRIKRGEIKPNDQVVVVDREGKTRKAKILQVMGHEGLDRIEVASAQAGSIVCVTGVDKLNISDTICHPEAIEALPALSVDEPTVSMTFQVNDSPFAGLEGKFVTSRNIKERLEKELISNVALRVEQGESPDKFIVSGRGELHLSVLIETMRREGFELAIAKPQVIQKEIDGEIHEPYEMIVIDVEEQHQGAIMEEFGPRKAELKGLEPDGKGRVKLEFVAPSRGIIGFRSQFLTITSGTGIMTSVFDHYGPAKAGELARRNNGVMYSMMAGKTLAYSLFNLQNRGRLFVGHALDVYIGQIVGLHSRENDLPVNPTKAKQLTNIRAAGTDENLILVPHIVHTLEQALEFIEDDELVEVTPNSIRMRKKGRVRT
ncbi:translational GTPase TypA [Gammaproteobacteria bacterium]|jgi:GTP-binding protein|nr:translational GTPase TypA [Gammaproteobacteria bacterium]MDA9112377.1 translational GTPase TypA [Gammaproteobacteria bacterium]MDB4059312.1 translational GTPase TypA [Gammaproteobacteria bacterium]MDB9997110.1 translational GTPase TypA [Gammaproteobacteria bacterium]MDC1190676.1 translational GTPase TypA [Gammaproteobacteria bacterium]|tara:strand:+ start:1025 stop:2815 length:1791 start_codon:yes stop_codon:yes gene_type:complete